MRKCSCGFRSVSVISSMIFATVVLGNRLCSRETCVIAQSYVGSKIDL